MSSKIPVAIGVQRAENLGVLWHFHLYVFTDHAPPHFHAIYAQYEAEVEISSGRILKGHLPRRALSLVTEWARLYRQELLQNWERARVHEPLSQIPSLE